MSWVDFGAKVDGLRSDELSLLTETIRHLLAHGWVWRDDDGDRRFYQFVVRQEDLIRQYLELGGWELYHSESARIFHLRQQDGLHRRHLLKNVTLWLLIVRLIYQEQREQARAALTALPLIKVSELYDRYLNFFPGQRVRAKGEFGDALSELRALRLIRAPEGGTLRPDTPDKLIELLPALEIVLPATSVNELVALMKQYETASPESEGDSA